MKPQTTDAGLMKHSYRKTGHGSKLRPVSLIQRFGSALNLNIHFHVLFLDGVYVDHSNGTARFR
jgi:hypothetical protein